MTQPRTNLGENSRLEAHKPSGHLLPEFFFKAAYDELHRVVLVSQTKLTTRKQQGWRSRVAKVKAADESVSLDLLIRSLLALGATDQDLAKAIIGRGA